MNINLSTVMLAIVATLCGQCIAAPQSGENPLIQTDDWPQFRGPNRNGISSETGWTSQWTEGGPRVLWRASVGVGFSSFAVAAGRVFTMGNSNNVDTVYCFDAGTGKALWQHSYPCEAQPLSYEGGPGATPAVADGRVYTFSKSGHLFCLNAENGKVIWTRKFDLWPYREGDWRNNWRYAGSPLVVGARLFVSVGEAGMALNKDNGDILWKSTAGHPGYSSPIPVLAGSKQSLAFFSAHAVYAVDAETGNKLWDVPWQTLWDLNAADPIFDKGKMFVSSGNGTGCALFDISTHPPRQIWRNKNIKNMMNSSILWKGFLYGFSDTHFSCVSCDTGEEKWHTREARKGSLILAGEKLLLLSENGKLIVAEPTPDAYKPLAEAQVITGRCWTTPVLSAGRIYVRNATGDVVCLDVSSGRAKN